MRYFTHQIFGWWVHKGEAEAGHEFDIVVQQEVPPNRLSAQAIYTKGRITGYRANDPTQLAAERVPGFGHDLLPNPVPAVTVRMTVQEDAEWWCVSSPANDSLPVVEYIRLQPGENLAVHASDMVFICAGQAECNGRIVTGPVAVRISSDTSMVALDSSVYGMKFDSVGAAG